MKIFFIIFFNLFISLNSGIKNKEIDIPISTIKVDCEIKNVILKTELVEKNRKFLFWPLSHKKVISINRVIDSNGDILFERKSITICSMDACEDRTFQGIKIVDNEIWLFNYNKILNPSGNIKRYNFCKEYLGTKSWEDGDFFKR
ncbi:hypothetical protein [uncultured Dokdonia sp.]|uniref:hypothetical protein n=1 Tax=uncultured Dokdonia sp. TaxID=575653 RepID=UPI00260F4817|nr:hypothetical protein [uncultured Dokdonia sp.]